MLSDQSVDELAAHAFEDAPAPVPRVDADTEFTVGDIRIVRQTIFESEADVWFKRAVNNFHTVTRERVIRSTLAFKSGSRIHGWQIEEAERVLRDREYLYDARVFPRRICGDVVDLDIVTRDVWTLNPRLIFERSGGENDVGFGLSDRNVLGTGKAASIGYERDQDREGWSVAYRDPNVAGSHWLAGVEVTDNDDGGLVALDLVRPFFSLATRYSGGLRGRAFDREQKLYQTGDDFFQFDADTRAVSIFGGISDGVVDGVARRWIGGVRFEEHDFDLPFDPRYPSGRAPGAEDRKLVYPFIAYHAVQNEFVTDLNVARIHRTEDIALGRRWYAELGYSDDAFGGEGSELVFRTWLRDAERWKNGQLFRFGASLSGRYDTDEERTEGLLAGAYVDYTYRHADQFAFFVAARATSSRRLPIDRQLLLGGDTGMRGYPNRYQAGDHRFIVTAEERFYSNIYPFRMFRLGAAVFADVGRAWFEDDPPPWMPADDDGEEFDTLIDVGVGLRLESTRTRRDALLHLDVGFPLTDGPDVRGVEVTITAKRSL